jgi:hypothetical protein
VIEIVKKTQDIKVRCLKSQSPLSKLHNAAIYCYGRKKKGVN